MERVGDVFLAREPVTYASHSGFTPIARSLDLLRAGLTVQEGGLVGTVELLPGRWCFKDTVALRYLRKQNLWLLGWRMKGSSWASLQLAHQASGLHLPPPIKTAFYPQLLCSPMTSDTCSSYK